MLRLSCLVLSRRDALAAPKLAVLAPDAAVSPPHAHLMGGNVLVTGGAGYIGSHTCKALARAGYTPIVYDNLSHGHPWAVQWGPLCEADLLDAAALSAALTRYQVVAVLHFAALTAVGESAARPDLYYQNNVSGTVALLEAMQAHKVHHLVFSSSCAVYGEPQTLPIDETHALRPCHPYGQSKLMVEQMLIDYCAAFALKAVSLRYFNAAGADLNCDVGEAHDPETHLIPRALRAALGSGPPVTVFGSDYKTHDGSCSRDYVHVSDLAQAHVLALNQLLAGTCAPAYNLGSGQGVTVLDVLAAVQRVVGQRVPRELGPRRENDPAALLASAAKAQRELRWQPQVTAFDEIVRSAWQWQLKCDLDSGA